MSGGHQIIEASAGTGKTYTIEGEVVRLIAEEQIPLPRILIVTYTEKATGELRRRIREKLEGQWRKTEDPLLRESLDAFDEAAIYTIHGFCQRVLSEYAFETGQPFNLQLLNDPQIWERHFARSLRGYWRRSLLSAEDLPRSQSAYENEFYQGVVIPVAGRYLPGDALRPRPGPLPLIPKRVEAALAALDAAVGDTTAFLKQAQGLKLPGATKKALGRALENLFAPLAKYRQGGMSDVLVAEVLAWTPSDSFLKHWERLAEEGILPEAGAAAIRDLLALKAEGDAPLIVKAIQHLYGSVSRAKREGGMLDFNDMLLLVREALRNEGACAVLRGRYDCALVDEFQDTDQVQWEIFRTLFTADGGHRLTVVGDPKQAIYSFRGANVRAYQAATRALAKEGAQTRCLDTNWRSHPPLIRALNRLFADAHGWFGSGEIRHSDVAAPPAEKLRARLYADASGRRPLTLVRPPDEISASEARSICARFYAQEIQHLLNSGIEIAEWRGGKLYRRPLHAGDCCLLIRARTELPALERALRAAGIPYTIPGRNGLFASLEALEMLLLLRAVDAPEDPAAALKALLTRFFPCCPEEAASYLSLPGTHPLKMLLAHWHHLAQQRAWAALFDDLFAATGVLVRALEEEDGERCVTNYQHLTQLLHGEAIRTQSTLPDLIQFLDERRRHAAEGGEETDLQRVETERRKVQIMTMHSAKGLEFPVVFIAGGFTGGKSGGDYYSYTTASGRIYDFLKSEESKQKQDAETDEDLRRLFYVALTRARYKLYLPYLAQLKRDSGGPLSGFIAAAVQSAWPESTFTGDDEAAYLPVDGDGVARAKPDGWKPPLADAAGVPLLDAAADTPALDTEQLEPPRIDPAWGMRYTHVVSYSSLETRERFSGIPEEPLRYDDPEDMGRPLLATAAAVEEEAVPPEAAAAADLPPGRQTGALLHAILKDLDFAAVRAAADPAALLQADAPLLKLLDPLLQYYPLRPEGHTPADRLAIATFLWRALHTPLPFLDGEALGAVAERRHEVEFWLPARKLAGARIPGVRRENTYLTGIIDLIFHYGGKYYLLDWKSNISPEGDYGAEAMRRMMQAHQYDLQYRLYAVALDRMLRAQLSDYDPERQWGGVCYLFLRGLTGAADSPGIYFDPAPAAAREQFEARLAERLDEEGSGR